MKFVWSILSALALELALVASGNAQDRIRPVYPRTITGTIQYTREKGGTVLCTLVMPNSTATWREKGDTCHVSPAQRIKCD